MLRGAKQVMPMPRTLELKVPPVAVALTLNAPETARS
jgi:hypothetical protein